MEYEVNERSSHYEQIVIFVSILFIVRSSWKPKCSTRTAMITFFMIVALVLGTAVALAIVFGVVNASKNGSGSNSADGNSGKIH